MLCTICNALRGRSSDCESGYRIINKLENLKICYYRRKMKVSWTTDSAKNTEIFRKVHKYRELLITILIIIIINSSNKSEHKEMRLKVNHVPVANTVHWYTGDTVLVASNKKNHNT